MENLCKILPEIENKSNCIHRQVGSILFDTIENKIIATGTNITPASSPCQENHCCTKHITGLCPVIHSEVNCIFNALEDGYVNFSNAFMLCTYSPCFECSKVLVRWKVPKLYYIYKHHRTQWEYLKRNGVDCIQLEPEGYKNEEKSNIT